MECHNKITQSIPFIESHYMEATNSKKPELKEYKYLFIKSDLRDFCPCQGVLVYIFLCSMIFFFNIVWPIKANLYVGRGDKHLLIVSRSHGLFVHHALKNVLPQEQKAYITLKPDI